MNVYTQYTVYIEYKHKYKYRSKRNCASVGEISQSTGRDGQSRAKVIHKVVV